MNLICFDALFLLNFADSPADDVDEVIDDRVDVATSTLFVKNLNFDTRDDGLYALFSTIGPLR